MPADDAELLAAWAKGERAAADELVERHFASMYRFFRSKVEADVEDLVQETLAAAIAGRDRLRDAASFRAYLFGIARNILRQHFRRKHVRRYDLDFEVDGVAELSPGLSSVVGKRQELRILSVALARLPVDYQIILELQYWERLTGLEIAHVLGMTEPGVRSRLNRAKKALRTAIEDASGSAELAESTWTGLDRWAAGIANELEPKKSKFGSN